MWLLVECEVMADIITQHSDLHKYRHHYHQALAARGVFAGSPFHRGFCDFSELDDLK